MLRGGVISCSWIPQAQKLNRVQTVENSSRGSSTVALFLGVWSAAAKKYAFWGACATAVLSKVLSGSVDTEK